MLRPHRHRRARARAGLAAGVGALVALSAGLATASGSTASAPYRHGTVPFRTTSNGSSGAVPLMLTTPPMFNAVMAPSNTVQYGGGIIGVDDSAPIGVITGPPEVYLVFWGAQWGGSYTTTLNGASYTALSGDPAGMAPDLQAFFSGLGTGSEAWSRVATQYCQSTASVTVPWRASTCPAGAAHVSYPTAPVLAGVWEDTATLAPETATAAEIAQEAETAAAHFGNTTPASNRNVEYIIVSPTNTHPDGFGNPNQNFCAWHDDSADVPGMASQSNGTVAFTNMPYLPDAGTACGAYAVNHTSLSGIDDGVSIVASHEYAEWLTDPYPGGGWFNQAPPSNPSSQYEIADECAWITSGQGAMTSIALATGSFPVQANWSNFNGACENISLVLSPALSTRTDAAGSTIRPLYMTARDLLGGQTPAFSALGLPKGLAIGLHTGTISGRVTGMPGAYRVRVSVTDSAGVKTSAAIAWTILNDVVVARPGTQATPPNHAVRLRITARDLIPHRALRYAAHGLPGGLAINPTTGAITGTAKGARHTYTVTVTVTVTDSGGSRGRTSFTWKVA